MPHCITCDYNRCVLSPDECGSGRLLKKAVRTKLREATVCLNPRSPYHGKHQRQNATCEHYAWSIDDREKVLTKLVGRQRAREYNLSPIPGDASIGYAPYYFQ
jgi:hypothetical protein